MILDSEAKARAWLSSRAEQDPHAIARLDRLEAMLRLENARQNLVSARSLDTVWVRHFADSAQLLEHVPRETDGGPWLDLGSGAGFPGLVIASCRPDLEVVLVECRVRRAAWLAHAIAELKLSSARVAAVRVEGLAPLKARFISARAFAPLPRLIALSARFSTPQTQWLLPKGRGGAQELAAMPGTLQAMFHVEQSLTDADSVILVGRGVPPQRTKRP